MKRAVLAILVIGLAASISPTMSTTGDTGTTAGASQSILRREPQLRPAGLGNGALAGLQFADPAEQLVVMAPPEANYQGGAELEHPLLIPPGRGGFQPKLALTYDSAGGNGWVGTGWDLSVGEISVDTRWGVPRFDPLKESETYQLDGQVLNPTAVRAEWQARVPERSDFTRRVETEYELIIRHGTNPKDYWWEVRDKMGGIRWYGGYPDDGGPSVGVRSVGYPGCDSTKAWDKQPTTCQSLRQDPSAILFDDKGNAYRWALSAQRDVGVNMIRYSYETVPGQRVGAENAPIGRRLYLTRIQYTAAASASPAYGGIDETTKQWIRWQGEDPAYEIRLLRDRDISPTPTPRRDVIVDARGGFVEVTSDLLRRVEVWHGAPPQVPRDENGQPLPGTVFPPRNYNILSRRYDLIYQEGAFGKTLLRGVNQIGSDGAVYGTHLFDYYDDVRDSSGKYNGFAPAVAWKTGIDDLKGNAIAQVPLSALGASETNGGDVHAYIGFNPSNPTKSGSFGGALTINGGATEALAEMLDINGDGLPDKIFRKVRNGPISYRLNTSGPSRTAAYSEPALSIPTLNKLSTEFNIGLAGSIEAYFAAMIQFMIAGSVTVGQDYFADVNGDGLPDFVSGGTVYFNHLDAGGTPTFETDSSKTPAPISNAGSATLPTLQAITDLEAERRRQSPLQDTVRRWVAPFGGKVTIDAPVTLAPPTASGNAPYRGDGVRVAIQHNSAPLWASTLTNPGTGVTPVLTTPLAVAKGDRLYFRVQAIDDGARDQVLWNPTVTYEGTPAADANGLSQKTYRASDDFTLAGRPNLVGLMPLEGTVRFEGTLYKTKATTDDVTVLVLKNGSPVIQQVITAATGNSTTAITGSFQVAGPNDTTKDKVEVRVAVDSPIDVTAVRLDHRLFYTQVVPAAGQQPPPVKDASGNPTLVLQIPADIDIYPENNLVAPRTPWVSNIAGTVTARASLNVGPNSGGGDVIVTVKDESGLIAKKKITVSDSGAVQALTADFPVNLVSGKSYWFDFTIRKPPLSEKASGQAIQLVTGNGAQLASLDPGGAAIDVDKMSTAGRLAHLAATGRLDLAIAQARAGTEGGLASRGETATGRTRGSGIPGDGGRGGRSAGAQSELSIAVDDTGRHIVVGATDPRGYSLSPVSVAGFAYSDDGGATWVDGGTLPVTTGTSTVGNSVLPQVFGNPEVKYLGGSNFVYFSVMVKKLSADQAVQTLGFHRSTDYGHTWTGPFEVTAATNPHGLPSDAGAPLDAADRPFADVDPETGRVLVSWNNFTTVSPGQEMSTTYCDNILDAVPAWSSRVIVSAVPGDQNAIIPRFSGGGSREAYVAWPRSDSGGAFLRFARSTNNGATWSESTSVPGTLVDENAGSDRGHMFPRLAVDNSGGANRGSLYLVYVVSNDPDGADVAFQRSTDGGRTFSSPVLLNSRPGNDRAQWIPWVTVDNLTGRVHVSYYDQDVARKGDLTETAHLFSDDAGRTWSKPAPLTDRPFHAGFENPAGRPNPGEHNQAVAQGGQLYAVWAGRPDAVPSADGQPASTGMAVPDINFRRVSDGQASLRLGKASIADGDGNGSLDAGEAVRLTLPLENYVTNSLSRAPISGISATLSSATPGVSVVEAGSAYPDLAPGAAAANSTSYLITLGPSFVPGTRIDLALAVASSENPATLLYTLEPSASDAQDLVLLETVGGVAHPGLPGGEPASQGAANADESARPRRDVQVRRDAPGVTAGGGPYFANTDVPSVLNWAGRQGAFPISYRGWGYAGYNGDGTRASQPINEDDFVFKPEQFLQSPTEPTDFNDPNFKDASQSNSFVFLPARVDILDANDLVVGTFPAWKGVKDNILGAADLMRTSRRGADSPSLGIATGAGVQAVQRVGVAAPMFSLSGGIGPASAGFAAGPSFGLLDYMDLNGDGFPDIVAPGYVKYTGPRGGFISNGDGVNIVNQDTSFEVSAGAAADGLKITANAQGKVSATRSGSSASTGGSAAKSQYGAGVGGSIGITASFTNPIATDTTLPDPGKVPVDRTAPLQQTLADVNGDGLPDRILVAPQGVFVRLNLGYRFAEREIRWASGGFDSNESYAGSVGGSLGFTMMPSREFSAGLGLTESIDLARYAWIDVDGDGILDRLHKGTEANSPITVAFGTNSGLMPDVVYGPVATGTFELGGIPFGEQIALGRSRGVGAGFDFTIGVGPLCIAACYLIINPGVHFDHSISTTQIQLTDVDGDGYPDSVKSTADNEILVGFNNRGRTNLLKQVRNPLGGSIRLGYKRDGNTVGQPNSIWTLGSVEVDDGRPGDGVDVRLSTFEYTDGRYNRLEREMLGYRSVIERQRKFAGDGDVANDPVLRVIERNYLNNTVFDSGLLSRQAMSTPAGVVLQETRSTWSLIDLATKAPAILNPTPEDPAGRGLLTMAVAPLQTKVEQRWFEPSGAVGQETWTTYEYDGLGNVVRQVDVGEPELADDDLITTIEYTKRSNASDSDNYDNWLAPLPGGAPPYWHPDVCPTWTSLPARLTTTNGLGAVLRKRDGAPALCDNSSITDLKEWFGPDARDYARTRLSYDAWGSYDTVWYPDPAGDRDDDPADLHDKPIETEKLRLRVDYVYDNNGHANIGSTTDSHGLNATATFDGRTGRIAKRTDANGQVTTYSYDAFGRLASITGPYEQGTGTPTVRFEYHADDPRYAYAIARHFDVRHPGDTIDTVTFVDGIGRKTQTKQDGTIFRGAGAAPTNVMLVSPAVEYDALGRTVKTRYPISEPLGNIGTFNTGGGLATTMEWDLLDRQTKQVNPVGRLTTTTYGFGGKTDFGARLFSTMVADPMGKLQTTWTDVRNRVIAVDDGQPVIRTRYSYDPMGQLIQVTDNAGNVTTHTYDLMGRGIATQTPDGGLVETRWDGASNIVAKITPNLRAVGKQITYSYDIDRLTGVDYPDATPDVAYTYGGPGAPGNAAGRVTKIVDAARTRELAYDRLGEVATERDTMFLHNGPSDPFTTSFTHDHFGRLLTMTYPDGEVLTHQYDSGGLLSSLQGRKLMSTGPVITDYLRRLEYDEFQSKRYQEFGNGVRTEFSYDSDTRRLTQQMTDAPARRVQDLNYTYDLVGNVLGMDNKLPPPQTELKGGPSRQEYTYDPYYRLQSAKGSAPQAPNRQRKYEYALTYDSSGNIQSKTQRDTTYQVTSTGVARNPKPEDATTYQFSPMTYNPARPHQLASTGVASYSYDGNGNLTRILNAKGQVTRIINRDAEDRAVRIDDASNSTDYSYDHQGLLGVQRDSLGETAFVNDWYQTTNQGWEWREIWVGENRIAQATEKLDQLGNITKFHYYQHEDLQGTTNLVTDFQGLVFEHNEYFPGGELWISEKSTTHRTPYRFVGALNDEARNLHNLGVRWYEPREQMFYNPEPLLYAKPESVIGDPALLPAYTYAESNPLRLVDNDGRAPRDVQDLLAAAFEPRSKNFTFDQALTALSDSSRHSRLWQSLVRYSVSAKADRLEKLTERFSAKPLVEFELDLTGVRPKLTSVQGGLFIFKPKWAKWEADAAQPGAGSSSAASQQGGGQSSGKSRASLRPKKAGGAAAGVSNPVRPKSGN